MKNKYCLSIALYDSRKLIDNNCLFYFSGLIDKLLIVNRDFDIKLHITEKCKDILDKIIKQEEIDIKDVQYIPIRESNDARGMVYRLKTCFDNLAQYQYIATGDGDNEYISNFHDYDDIENFSITAPQRVIDGKFYFMWGEQQIIPGGICVFNGKNFITNIVRCIDVLNQILTCDSCEIFYGFDEQLLTHLCIKEFLSGRIKYFIYNHNKYNINEEYIKECVHINGNKYYYKYNKRWIDSKYYWKEKKTYTIDGKEYLVKSLPSNCKQHYMGTTEYNMVKRKYLMYKLQQYVTGYSDRFDINEIYSS